MLKKCDVPRTKHETRENLPFLNVFKMEKKYRILLNFISHNISLYLNLRTELSSHLLAFEKNVFLKERFSQLITFAIIQ